VLLGQLSAWAESHQDAFEVEERLKAEAAIHAEKAGRRPTGFSPG
jgi:hypothetical protein